jgi:hypothetical protein
VVLNAAVEDVVEALGIKGFSMLSCSRNIPQPDFL